MQLLDIEDPVDEYGLSEGEVEKVDQIAQNLWGKYRETIGEQINPRNCCEEHRYTDISLAATIHTAKNMESEEADEREFRYRLPENFQDAVYDALDNNEIGIEDMREDLAKDMSTMDVGETVEELLSDDTENADIGIH